METPALVSVDDKIQDSPEKGEAIDNSISLHPNNRSMNETAQQFFSSTEQLETISHVLGSEASLEQNRIVSTASRSPMGIPNVAGGAVVG